MSRNNINTAPVSLEQPQAIFVDRCDIAYKVEYKGLTHFIVGTLHGDNGNKNLSDAYRIIANSVSENLVKTGRVKNLYVELLKPFQKGSKLVVTGLDYAIYSAAQLDDSNKPEMKSIEHGNEVILNFLIMIESNTVYQWSEAYYKDYPMLTTLGLGALLAAILLAIWVPFIAGYVMGYLPFSVAIIGCLFFLGYLNMNTMKSLLQGGAYNSMSLAGAIVMLGGQFDYVLGPDNIMIEGFKGVYKKLLFKARNETFADKILGETEPSLFAYGAMHNQSIGDESMPSVLELLERVEGVEITPIKTLEGLKPAGMSPDAQ